MAGYTKTGGRSLTVPVEVGRQCWVSSAYAPVASWCGTTKLAFGKDNSHEGLLDKNPYLSHLVAMLIRLRLGFCKSKGESVI